MTVIDDYLQKIDPPNRAKLEQIRKMAKQIVPDSQETISYGMPTLQLNGVSFLGFDFHKNHIGIYPYGAEEIHVFKDKLLKLGYGFSKGAIRVPLDTSFPEDLLRKIINHRIKRISNIR